MIVTIFGGPGSGKSTQMEMLGKAFNLPLLALGNEFRRLVKEKAEDYKIIDEAMRRGEPVPIDIVERTVKAWINKTSETTKKGYVSDGFPRRLVDIEVFHQKILPSLEPDMLPFIGVIELAVPLDVALERIRLRHEKNPERLDEKEKETRRRYEWYSKDRDEIKEYYQKINKWFEIDGTQTPEKIGEDLHKLVKERKAFLGNQLISVLGPIGAGKDTQAEAFKKYGYTPFSAGQAFRDEMAAGTKVGKEIDAGMRAGKITPFKQYVAVVFPRLEKMLNDGKKIFASSLTRDEIQLEPFEKFLARRGDVVKKVIFLNIDEETLLERVIYRRVCEKCNAMYHQKFFPPKQKGVCDECGGKLVKRFEDSTPEKIRTRIKVFNEKMGPVLDYYRESGRLYEVDGSPSPEEVTKKMREIIEMEVD